MPARRIASSYWACSGGGFFWYESQIGAMKDYAEPTALAGIPTGIIFGFLAIALWTAFILKEVRSIAGYLLLLDLPSPEDAPYTG